jgi:hypothetical protein
MQKGSALRCDNLARRLSSASNNPITRFISADTMAISVSDQINTLSGEIRLQEHEPKASNGRTTAERRAKPRLAKAMSASVWGTDAQGKKFEIDSVIDNMSSRGIYLRMPWAMSLGVEINLAISFSNGQPRPNAVVRGEVLRDEPLTDGRHGVAVAIREHHFI